MSEAPRWRLMAPHYINVPGTEWEHREVNSVNGKAVRKLFTVPCLLDTKSPNDFNYPGEIIVGRAVDGAHNPPNDIIFLGDPTPDMEPLNEAAQAITDALRPKWEHPIDTLPVNGGMSSAEQAFMDRMMNAFAGAAQVNNQSVPKEQFDALQDRLAKLEAMLAAQNKPAANTGRRV